MMSALTNVGGGVNKDVAMAHRESAAPRRLSANGPAT